MTQDSHCVVTKGDVEIRIPLKLKGIFSYFPTRALTADEIDACEEMEAICLTPGARVWDPNDDSWAEAESRHIDHEGNSVMPKPNKRRRLIEDDVTDVGSAIGEWITPEVSAQQWENAIDANINAHDMADYNQRESFWNLDQDDPIRAQVCDLTGILDTDQLLSSMEDGLVDSELVMAAGCTLPTEEDMGDSLFLGAEASATEATRFNTFTKEHLAKVWRLNEDEARRTLEVTTQLKRHDVDPLLSRQFGTNDRMLRYRCLRSTFFYTMMQIFVSDKGFVRVYGMTSVTQIPQAMKLFAKEVGTPNCFVYDPHANQKSKEVRDFCHSIGITLRILEERTQHANRAELYIGLLKEAVRKDMRETNSPLRLWCYCAERRASILTLTAKNLYQLEGTNPYTATLGEAGDISALCQFG